MGNLQSNASALQLRLDHGQCPLCVTLELDTVDMAQKGSSVLQVSEYTAQAWMIPKTFRFKGVGPKVLQATCILSASERNCPLNFADSANSGKHLMHRQNRQGVADWMDCGVLRDHDV